jgi:putative ABC transport system permease protein
LAIGRLAEGVSIASADAEIRGLAEQLAAEYPSTNSSRRYQAVGFREAAMPGSVRADVVRMSVLLLAIVGALWLVVCLNVSNLLFARTLKRRRELAVRRALGSGRKRIVWQLLLEFMAIAGTAGIVGMVLARTIASGLARLPLPIAIDVGLDVPTVAFAGALAVASGILCALAPSVMLSRGSLNSISAAASARTRRRWPSRVLIVCQVAVSLVLVFATGLFVRSFSNLSNADPGFDSTNLLTAEFMPELQGYDSSEILDFFQRLTERATSIPGVEAVAMADGLPAAGNFGQDSWFFENAREPEQGSSLYRSVVSTNFFETLGIAILQGRGFSEMDSPERPPVLIVNQAAARLVEARTGQPAVGQRIGPNGPAGPFLEIVGVVGDTRTGRASQAPPFVYGAHSQLLPMGLGGGQMVVMLKTSVSPESLAGALRTAALAVDPGVSASNLVTMDSFLADLLAADRLTVSVLGVSSLLAMLLVAIGVYGLLAYVVSQRTHEFGVRLALGARALNLTGIVLREALVLALVGLALGAAGSLAAMRFAESQLFGVSSTDPMSLTLGIMTVVGVTLAAAYVPARRATRIDPMVAIQVD